MKEYKFKVLNLSNLTSYKKLILYQKSRALILLIYGVSEKFPKNETYALVSQIRRATVSIMANIVDGYSKGTSAEYARFLTISIGSLTEVEVYLDLSLDLKYINSVEYERVYRLLIEVKKLLYSSRKSIRERLKR